MNYAYLLLWPATGLIALAITVNELRKVGATFTELIEYLHQLKSSRPLGKTGIMLLCVFIVALGPISLVPIVMDAIKRART